MDYLSLVDLIYNEAISNFPQTTAYQIPSTILAEVDVGTTMGRVGNTINGRIQIELLNGQAVPILLYPLAFNLVITGAG